MYRWDGLERISFSEVVGANDVITIVPPVTIDIPQETVTEIVPQITIETVTEVAKEIITNLDTIQIRYSFYHPWLGGTNCSRFIDGQCISKMASGKRWQDYLEYAIACPPEWSFGTKIIAFGQEWVCEDRGGKIQYVDEIPWVDFLTENPQVPYGTILDVEIVK